MQYKIISMLYPSRFIDTYLPLCAWCKKARANRMKSNGQDVCNKHCRYFISFMPAWN